MTSGRWLEMARENGTRPCREAEAGAVSGIGNGSMSGIDDALEVLCMDKVWMRHREEDRVGSMNALEGDDARFVMGDGIGIRILETGCVGMPSALQGHPDCPANLPSTGTLDWPQPF